MAQDVLEGNNINTALAKRSKEAIGGLVVPQAGSCRKSTKRKVQFRGLQNYKILIPVIFNHFTTMSRVVKNNLLFLHLLTCCPEHQRQFLLETATPEQIHALVQILFNMCHGNIPVSKEVKRNLKKSI